MCIRELFDHRGHDAIAGATELGDELDLAGQPHLTRQGFQKVFDLGRSAVGLHIGEHRSGNIALAGMVLSDECISGVILARLGAQAIFEYEGTQVDVQVFHQATPGQALLFHHASTHQRSAVEQLPGILDRPHRQDELTGRDTLAMLVVIGHHRCLQLP
ncbi:hypothetical protein D3C75_832720 [compost metagenome]